MTREGGGRRFAAVATALVLLMGCDRSAPAPIVNAGASLEIAARARGIVGDPTSIDPVGAYSGDTDRVCIVRSESEVRIGATVDYGEGQGCSARGTARGRGTLDIRLGDGCRFTATLDNDRIVFPAVLPPRCDRACRGRASLSSLAADRLSASEAEARSMPGPDGHPLCS